MKFCAFFLGLSFVLLSVYEIPSFFLFIVSPFLFVFLRVEMSEEISSIGVVIVDVILFLNGTVSFSLSFSGFIFSYL